MTLTKEEWIERCAARFQERGGLSEYDAQEAAIEMYALDIKDEDPVDMADQDMLYWTNDE